MAFYYYIYAAIKSVPDWAACALPVAAVAALSVWHALKKRHRAYAVLCAAIHVFSIILYLPRMELSEALFCVSACVFLNIPLAFLYRVKRPARDKKNAVEDLAKECITESAARAEGKFKQEKILCYSGAEQTDDVYKLDEEGISLNHAIGLATKLKRARLAVGDRLEADNIYRILMDFRAKNNLTGEEFSSLNGYLSTLLKLAAKYSL